MSDPGAPESGISFFLDPGEELQSSFPVEEGRILVTQSRLYVALDGREGVPPNVRLERSRPRVFSSEEWVEIAPRIGACLKEGQDGREFLALVEPWRRRALDDLEERSRRSREGVRASYERLLQAADRHGQTGAPRKRKDTLRTLYVASPERTEAAERLGETYLAEGNARAAVLWLSRAGIFDARFDAALERVLRPRLPSRENPPPEWWIDRHLLPLLDREDGPSPEQEERIHAARRRIHDHRTAWGRAGAAAQMLFVLALAAWVTLMLLRPWWTLASTAAAALAVGLFSLRRARGRRRPKR